jgi:FkbM family methyltransferase
MMQSHQVWLPDGDAHLVEYFGKVRDVDGRGAYQHEKWLRAKPGIRQWRTAVDVGAHVGLWTMTLAKCFSRVVCFEPMPTNRECWIANLGLMLEEPLEVTTAEEAARGLRRWLDGATQKTTVLELWACALGGVAGEADLALERAGWSGCVRVIPPDEHVELASPKVRVPVRTLDTFALTRIDFLKIDTEGYERHVLAGGLETIRRERPAVLVEQKPGLAQRFGLPETGAVRLLQQEGARLHWEQAGDYFLTFPERGGV